VLLLVFAPFCVEADGTNQEGVGDHLSRRYVLGIAAGLERFDTNVKITNRSSGNSIFVDGESSFGLPETQLMPILYGGLRINKRHGFAFHIFNINRNGDDIQVNEDFGRLQVNGRVQLSDKSTFAYFNYMYGLFDDGRVWIRAMFGIYAIDLKLDLEATGQITLDGVPVESGTYTDSVHQFAPLPLIGLDYWSSVTDRWFVGSRVAFIAGSYSDVSAQVVEANIRARYKLTDRLSLVTGVNYLSADVEVKRTNQITDTRYGYDGVFLGLDFSF
jgi:hypothetical protein